MAELILAYFKWLRNAYAVIKVTTLLILLCPWMIHIKKTIRRSILPAGSGMR